MYVSVVVGWLVKFIYLRHTEHELINKMKEIKTNTLREQREIGRMWRSEWK